MSVTTHSHTCNRYLITGQCLRAIIGFASRDSSGGLSDVAVGIADIAHGVIITTIAIIDGGASHGDGLSVGTRIRIGIGKATTRDTV